MVDAIGPGVADLAVGAPVAGFDLFGGFAGTVTAPAAMLQALPRDLPSDHGCSLEPLSCCLQAVRRGAVPAGATALITGAGSNGLLIAQLLRKHGAIRTIVSEPDPRRRALALELGADEVIDPVTAPLAEALGGTSVQVAFETAGSLAADRDTAIDAAALLPALTIEPLISHRYPLGEIGAAFDAARTSAGLKVIVYP